MFKIYIKRAIYCHTVMNIIDSVLIMVLGHFNYTGVAQTIEYSIVKPLMNWLIQ